MNNRDNKLPKSQAKRYGHRSTVHSSQMIASLGKGNFFERSIEKLRKYISGGDTHDK